MELTTRWRWMKSKCFMCQSKKGKGENWTEKPGEKVQNAGLYTEISEMIPSIWF